MLIRQTNGIFLELVSYLATNCASCKFSTEIQEKRTKIQLIKFHRADEKDKTLVEEESIFSPADALLGRDDNISDNN